MEVVDEPLPGVMLLRATYHADQRGTFAEIFSRWTLEAAGLPSDFVQDNELWSGEPGTLRGLHWQRPPFAQAKLVRVLKGAIFDIAVDLRRASSSYGRHVAVELSAGNKLQLLIPRGFAHGLLTLEPDTAVLYKVDAPYAATAEGGLHWADPDLALPWPEQPAVTVISPKDNALPNLRDLQDPFIV